MIKYTDIRFSFDEQDLVKNVINDIAVVSSNNAILQAILTRLLIPKGSYILNPKLGSDLYLINQSKSTASTEDKIRTMVLEAVTPEINAGNIDSSIEITTSRSNDKINVGLVFQLIDGDKQQLNLIIQ